MTLYKYKAFISYSHTDRKAAKQLLNCLESFSLPKSLVGDYPHLKSSKSVGRIFRDREELAASDSLEDEIISALEQSEYLIVLCSPASARSYRVAFEIETFLHKNSTVNILCLIVDGQPNFDSDIKPTKQNCIPEPLRTLSSAIGKVPVAADMRPVGDGPNLAFKKIIAGLLNVELDKLMQREARRLQKRVIMMATGGVVVTSLLIGLVINAQFAKNAEETAKNLALEQQARAENLIGFMVDDLVVAKLQQLGRVDVIDAVVNELVDHYVQQNDNQLTPDGLGRKARVFIELGRVYLRRQDDKQSKEMFERAYAVTKKMLVQYPDSAATLYDHVHTLYWLGRYELVIGNFEAAKRYWQERVGFFDKLMAQPDLSRRAYFEVGDLHIHLGWALMERGRYSEAKALFEKGLEVRQLVADKFHPELAWLNNVAGAYHHLAWAEEFLGNTERAIAHSRKSVEIYEKLWLSDKTDQRAHSNLARSYRWLAESEYSAGQYAQAKIHLMRSLEHFAPVLGFEPDDEDKQLQYCWSAVQMIEIEEKLGAYVPNNSGFENYCPNADNLMRADHIKAYNRLLGYRMSLVDIEHALHRDSVTPSLQQNIEVLTKHLNAETDEVLNSSMGRRIKMRHVVAVLKATDLRNNNLMSEVMNTIEDPEINNDLSHPEVSAMMDSARNLLSKTFEK